MDMWLDLSVYQRLCGFEVIGRANDLTINTGTIPQIHTFCHLEETREGKRQFKNASTGLGLYRWKGGRLTRKLFNWKFLPHYLACKEDDGTLFPENSEYSKRTKD
ncbi:DDT domain-containing protein [Artemisia annua]|uniref:DDT domain-containing protein n=1 Tax=Artemisia annua TaxID=35608 RepID=A0A2U1NN12_ARTAN|nr:DDT domain-containing protein [Artemisia annua]